MRACTLDRMGGGTEARRATILVVDDHDGVRRTTRAVLEQHGFDVIEACHGGEAMAVYRWQEPDLVLLDLEMPVVDGWTFLRLAQRASIETPVLVVSSSPDAASLFGTRCVVGVFPKPFNVLELIEAVKRALLPPHERLPRTPRPC